MMLFYILLLSLITTLPAASSPTDCIEAIESAVSQFLFLGAGEVALNCSNDLVSHSLWASAKKYCKENEILAGSVVLTEDCLESHSQLIPYRQVLPQLTDDYLKGLPVVNFNNISQHKVWNTSILISQDLYGIAKRTNVGKFTAYQSTPTDCISDCIVKTKRNSWTLRVSILLSINSMLLID